MKPKILLLDIETKPMESFFWRLYDEQGGMAMLKADWCILAWSAKWLDDKEIMYSDQSKAKDIEDEKKILEKLWKLLDEADVVIGHNAKKFDIKRINTRLKKHKFKPPSPYRVIDTLVEARKHFAFSSNKLEDLANFLGCKAKKLVKRKFPGFSLWRECLLGNKEAWKEMELYNKQDVIVLEEVYKELDPWINVINFNVFNEGEDHVCSCGSKDLKKNGTDKTNSGVFQRWKCTNCGKPYREKLNLLSPEKRKSMKVGVKR